MKELLIVRHANASLNFKSLKDFDRTLNPKGENESKLMAKQLLNSNFYPDCIISSGANRAFSTSKIIAKKINFSINEIKINDDIYYSSNEDIIEIVHNIPNEYSSIMLVGHNPTLHYLSQMLSGENIISFPTCSMYCISFDVDNWNHAIDGKKMFFMYPSMFN